MATAKSTKSAAIGPNASKVTAIKVIKLRLSGDRPKSPSLRAFCNFCGVASWVLLSLTQSLPNRKAAQESLSYEVW